MGRPVQPASKKALALLAKAFYVLSGIDTEG